MTTINLRDYYPFYTEDTAPTAASKCGTPWSGSPTKTADRGGTLNRPGWRNAVKLAVEQQADILVKDVCRVTRRMDLLTPLLSEMDKQGISIYTCDNGLLQIPETEKRLMEYLAQACK